MKASTMAQSERGVALLLTVFIVTISAILVTSLAYRSQFDLRASRNFTEAIQADYILKSCLSLGLVLIEAPKEQGISEDWLGDLWAKIGSATELPIAGIDSQPRLAIVDDRGKININAIQELGTGANQQQVSGEWKAALAQIFTERGGFQEQTATDPYQTIGDTLFKADQQVAVIHDWLDTDSQPHQSTYFTVEGIESNSNKELFYNRRLRTISELLLVPGMTRERLARIAPYIKIPPSNLPNDTYININTAPYEVLVAIQMPESVATEIVAQRIDESIQQQDLENIKLVSYGQSGTTFYQNNLQVVSNHFSIFARVKMPNSVRWLHSQISTGQPIAGGKRTAEEKSRTIF